MGARLSRGLQGMLGLLVAGLFLFMLTVPSAHALRAIWGTKKDVQNQDNSENAYRNNYQRNYNGPIVPKKLEVIKVWDKSNVEEIKDMLPPTMYLRVKDWGLVLHEIETIPYEHTDQLLEASKKYASQNAQMDESGELSNYVAGIPFPTIDPNDPQAGLKLEHNQDRRYMGDTFWMWNDFFITDASGGQRKLGNTYSRYMFVGRVINDPKPTIPEEENPRGLRFGEFAGVTYPFELSGFNTLQLSYIDRTHEDDYWIYLPSIRRTRRMSTAQRYDTFAGTDLCYEDFYMFNGFVSQHTYKFIGKKTMLLALHQMFWPPQKKEQLQFSPIIVERVPAYIVEQYPKDSKHIYSKRVQYFAEPLMQVTYQEMYDRKGELWKSQHWMWMLDRNHEGFPYLNTPEIIDYLTPHATLWGCRHEGYVEGMDQSFFTLENIRNLAR